MHPVDYSRWTQADLIARVLELERLQQESAVRLAERDAELNGFLDNIGFGVGQLDAGARYVQVNARYCEFLGYTREELLGRSPSNFVLPENQERIRQAIRDVIRTHDTSHFEQPYVRKDGRIIWLKVSATCILDAAGQFLRTAAIVEDVTARREAEKARTEAEIHYRALFEEAGVGVAELDSTSGRFLRVNRKNLEILQRTEAELLAMDFMALTHPEDLADDLANMEAMRAGRNRGFTLEKRLLRGDGTPVWVHLTVSPLWPPGAAPTTHMAVAKDISERKAAEAALRESESLFRTFFENAGVGMVILDRDIRFLRVNPRYCAITGYSAEELVGRRTPLDLDHPDDRERNKVESGRLMAGQTDVLSIEKRYLRRDGSVAWVHVKAANITDAAGNIVYVIGVIEDITARHEAGAALRQSEERLRLIENTVDSVFRIFDLQHDRALYVSGKIEALWGVPARSLMDHSLEGGWTHLIHPEDRAAVVIATRDGAARGVPFELEYRVNLPDGRLRWIRDRCFPMRDASGVVTAMAGAVNDVTERKQLEATLRAQERHAATGRLAAGVAHEINNPLNGIKNCLRLIKEAIPPEHPRRPFADLIDREIDRIAFIVQRLFTLYRPNREVAKEFAAGDLARDVIQLVGPEAAAAGVRVSFRGPENPARVRLPEASLIEIVHNLIRNAIDASPAGGKVILTLTAEPDTMRISVADSGPGIPAGLHDQIFEPFFTTKASTARSGMGLGLALVRTNVEALQGRVWFESPSGGGTVFSVELPRNLARLPSAG